MESKHDKFDLSYSFNSKSEKKHMRDIKVKRLMALGHTKKFARQAARRV
ncbi:MULTISPECIES: hypothetical protein [Providencia]|nr:MULTISPECIES: hypothetical protein [Providencia]MBG5919479.1 hypothetical protein [Providencia stuartii]